MDDFKVFKVKYVKGWCAQCGGFERAYLLGAESTEFRPEDRRWGTVPDMTNCHCGARIEYDDETPTQIGWAFLTPRGKMQGRVGPFVDRDEAWIAAEQLRAHAKA